MSEMTLEKKGASERLLAELLKSPKFKASLRILTANIDPETAKGLAKVLLWEDVETFMGTVSVLPAAVNFMVSLASEVAAQLNTFPPPVLVAFMSQLAAEVDFEAMREAVAEFKTVLDKLAPVAGELKEASSGVMEEIGTAGAAGAAGAK